MPVVFDSNVYVSAFLFGGGPLDLVEMGLDGSLDVVISRSIIEEILRVLSDKFQVTPAELERAISIMIAAAREIETATDVKAVKDDPGDDHVVNCAVTASAEAIVTGDKDLLRLEAYQGIRMMSVRAFLEQQRR